MKIIATEILIKDLNLRFYLGDNLLQSVTIGLGANNGASRLNFSIVDANLSVSDTFYKWSKANGGIKVPSELRGSNSTAKKDNGTSGGTPNPGTSGNGSKLEGLENEPVEVSAFMDTIAWCEGTYPDGYNVMFTFAEFSDFSDHPRQIQSSGGLSSDAAGRYQFLSTTWDGIAGELGLTDFSPKSQNIGGWGLAKRDGGVSSDSVVSNPLQALKDCAAIWASLPGSPYGQPTKSESEVQAQYDKVLAERQAKEPTTTPPEEGETPPEETEYHYYNSEYSATIKAFLDLISHSIGTYELGDSAYTKLEDGTDFTDTATHPGGVAGRYFISKELFDEFVSNEEALGVTGIKFDARSQDEIAIWILKFKIEGENVYNDILAGNIETAIENASKYPAWNKMSGGDQETLSMEESVKFLDSRIDYWVENTPVDPPVDAPDEDGGIINENTGGTNVEVIIRTETSLFRYQYILVDTDVTGFPLPILTVYCQSVRYALQTESLNENYEDVNAIELAQIIAAKYNIEIDDRTLTKKPTIERIDQVNETDLEKLTEVANDQQINVTDDPETGEVVLEDEEKITAKQLIIPDIIDLSFEDRGVTTEEPLYPVFITAIISDTLLRLKPEESVTLNNAYTFIPDSLKNDTWVISDIEHNIFDETTRIQLLKYIPVEVVSESGGVVGGGKVSLSELSTKYDPAVVKVGSATGWFVTADGYIMTAAHMQGQTNVETKDGRTFTAQEIDIDTGSDIMLMKVETSGETVCLIAPDTSIYTDGTSSIIYAIGHPGREDGSGQDYWVARESTVKQIAENGHKGLTGKVVVADDKTVNFVDPGNSGGPWFDEWGLAVSLTSGGDARGAGKGDEAWGGDISTIIDMMSRNNVAFTTGSRESTPSNGGGSDGGSDGGGGGVVDGWVLPSKGVLTSGFGPRTSPTAGASSDHKGWDLAAGDGADIYAASSGTVNYTDPSGSDGSGYGIYCTISHPSGEMTLYGHCKELLVSNGDSVSAGQLIAREDNTGTSTGSHLHFGIATGASGDNIFSGTFVDPSNYLPKPSSAYDINQYNAKSGKLYRLGLFNDLQEQRILGICPSGGFFPETQNEL